MSEQSFFDHTQSFSETHYAVTLATVPSLSQQHAHIIVEGVREGNVFRHYAHFTPSNISGYGEIKSFRSVPDRYEHHSAKTWVMPKDQVIKMMEDVESGPKYIPFSILGRNSIFNRSDEIKKDNCCTWALEQLKKAGIDACGNNFALGEVNLATATCTITQPVAEREFSHQISQSFFNNLNAFTNYVANSFTPQQSNPEYKQ